MVMAFVTFICPDFKPCYKVIYILLTLDQIRIHNSRLSSSTFSGWSLFTTVSSLCAGMEPVRESRKKKTEDAIKCYLIKSQILAVCPVID